MAKARMIGIRKRYVPNDRMDMRQRKKIYQHNRRKRELKDMQQMKQEECKC